MSSSLNPGALIVVFLSRAKKKKQIINFFIFFLYSIHGILCILVDDDKESFFKKPLPLI